MIGKPTKKDRRRGVVGDADGEKVEIRAQPKQEEFLSSPADVAIMGGAAGGGKTAALLLDPLRHVSIPTFAGVIFRRTYPEIMAAGGLWPESWRYYPYLGGKPDKSKLDWTFPGGATISFRHLQHEKDMLKWLGAQIPFIGFDQVETFSLDQFFYLLSRNRSVCGIRPYMRATANPRPGWLAELLGWWIDSLTGYPLAMRSGALRWLYRRDDVMEWDNSWEELHHKFPDGVCPPGVDPDGITEKRTRPKSFTFIPARLTDNPILMRGDPEYMANLQALPRVERERLLSGNWLIGDAKGEWPPEYFGPAIWFKNWPPDLKLRAMCLDPSKGKTSRVGDFSAWILLGVDKEDHLWVDCDMDNVRVVESSPSDPGRRSMVVDGIELYRGFQPHAVGVEINGFQAWVANALLRYSVGASLVLPLYGINSILNKQARIRTLTPYFAQGRFHVRNTPGGRLLVQQLREFPNPQSKDDGPDALKSCELLASYILSGQAEMSQIHAVS